MEKNKCAGNLSRILAILCTAVSIVSTGIGISAEAKSGAKGITLNLGSADYSTDSKASSVITNNQSLNTVRDSIFGANTSWVDDGYGLWDSVNDHPYSVMLNKLKASGVAHIRYPGGIEGDYLHWNEIVGKMSTRKPQINCFSSEYPTYDAYDGIKYPVTFGPDELFRLCKAAKTKATIQLNAGNGTPEEASDYVNYIIKNGNIDLVDSFCIGNEVCMSSERVDEVSVTKNPNEYIDFCKKVFSDLGEKTVHNQKITLGVCGITPSHPLCAYKNWDIKVLDSLAPLIDFIDVHIGYSYYYQNGESKETSAKCFMASSKWIGAMIEEEKNLIKKYAAKDTDHIGIQISELGPNGGDYVRSVAGAVFLGDLYNTILAEPQVTATDYLPLLNHYASAQLIGAMTYSGAGNDEYYWDNAVSYVFKMYSEQIGRAVLTTKLSGCGKFNSEACGMVPAVKDVENTSVAVYYDEKNETGSIFLINRSLNKNEEFNISLPTEKAVVTNVTELWNRDYMAANYYSNPNNVQLKSYKSFDKSEFGNIKVTTKPVSLVRIDFNAKDISVIAPKIVIGNSTGAKTEEKQPAQKTESNSEKTDNTASEKKADVLFEKTEKENQPEAVKNKDKKNITIRKILKSSAEYSGVVKALTIVAIVLAVLFIFDSTSVFIFILYRKRRRK